MTGKQDNYKEATMYLTAKVKELKEFDSLAMQGILKDYKNKFYNQTTKEDSAFYRTHSRHRDERKLSDCIVKECKSCNNEIMNDENIKHNANYNGTEKILMARVNQEGDFISQDKRTAILQKKKQKNQSNIHKGFPDIQIINLKTSKIVFIELKKPNFKDSKQACGHSEGQLLYWYTVFKNLDQQTIEIDKLRHYPFINNLEIFKDEIMTWICE